jgi:hypothetical protein
LEFFYILYNSHTNFSADSSIPLKAVGLLPFHFKKGYLNNKNIFNIFINFFKHFDILGRSMIILNPVVLKSLLMLNVLLDSLLLLKKRFNVIEEILVKKNLSNFLFYTEPKIYFFSNLFDFNYIINKDKKLSYSYTTAY